MNPFDKLGLTAGRVATLTSIIRSKREDEIRLTANGGVTPDVLHERVEAANAELVRVADELEAMI